jgi:hypothetical protein
MSKRMEKLRRARNLNEVLQIVKEIEQEATKDSQVANNLKRVLSSTSSEIKIDHSAAKGVVKISKFTAPNVAQIKKHNDLIKGMYAKAVELDAAEGMVTNSFGGQKGYREALSAIKTLKANVENSIAVAFDALENIAKKHQPKELETLLSKVVNYIQLAQDKNSDVEIEDEVYVTVEDKTIQFCNYINVKGLKDSQGFVAEDYFVVLTGQIVGTEMETHITSMHEFKPPGKYSVGRKVADYKATITELQKLFAHDSIHSMLEHKPLELEDEERGILTSIPGVLDAKVKDDILSVTVQNTTKDINSVVVSIMQVLKNIVGPKNRIRHKVKSGKKVVIDFMLTSDISDKGGINLSKLGDLKEMLDLDDNEVKAIKLALKRKTV